MYKITCAEILAQYGWSISFNVVLRKWTTIGEYEWDGERKEGVIGIANSPFKAAKKAQKNMDDFQDIAGV